LEHWQIYATAIATVLAVMGVTRAMCAKAESKVDTMFKRFDDYKHHLEETHVSKEVCHILHNQIIEDLCEVKADVKKLLIMAKNGNGK